MTATAGARAGGVVFRTGEGLHFLSAEVAIEVTPRPETARVPGAPPELVGVALVHGEMIPVVALPTARPLAGEGMLVCRVLGERVGLVGLEVVATGLFEVRGEAGAVALGAETARPFDVAAVIARVREGRWAV